jgi:hypothetical protein
MCHALAAASAGAVAVHFAEGARNAQPERHAGVGRGALALVGLFQALSEDGLPEGSQTTGSSVAAPATACSFCPTHRRPARQRTVGGGKVIENDPAWSWAEPARRAVAFAAFGRRSRRPPQPRRSVPAGRPLRRGPTARRTPCRRGDQTCWCRSRRQMRRSTTALDQRAGASASRPGTWRKGHGLPEQWDGLPFRASLRSRP